MTTNIPANFLLEYGEMHFSLAEGDCPAPDERCKLAPVLALDWVADAEPDTGAGVTRAYHIAAIDIMIFPETRFRPMSGDNLKRARAFLSEHHAPTLDALADELALDHLSDAGQRRAA